MVGTVQYLDLFYFFLLVQLEIANKTLVISGKQPDEKIFNMFFFFFLSNSMRFDLRTFPQHLLVNFLLLSMKLPFREKKNLSFFMINFLPCMITASQSNFFKKTNVVKLWFKKEKNVDDDTWVSKVVKNKKIKLKKICMFVGVQSFKHSNCLCFKCGFNQNSFLFFCIKFQSGTIVTPLTS